jgi:hypothetical protein
MSQFVEVLAKIDNGGGMITIRDQEVRLRVRPGLLTDQDREILARHRDDVLCMLTPVDVDTTTPNTAETPIVSTSTLSTDWEPEVEYHLAPLARCGTCGSFERWQDIRGGWHCAECEPPVKAERLRVEAARLRERNFTRRVAK